MRGLVTDMQRRNEPPFLLSLHRGCTRTMDKFLVGPEVTKIAGEISARTLRRWEKDGKFPRRRQIGPRRVGWLASEVAEWVASRPKVEPSVSEPDGS